MTKIDFFQKVRERISDLEREKEMLEERLFEVLASKIESSSSIDDEGNLVIKIDLENDPIAGLNPNLLLPSIPWVVGYRRGKKFSYYTVREQQETYITAIKPVIGFHS